MHLIDLIFRGCLAGVLAILAMIGFFAFFDLDFPSAEKTRRMTTWVWLGTAVAFILYHC